MEKKCKTCLLYNRLKGECKVSILVNGEELHMPVFPEDHCHMDELGIAVDQVRWFVENPDANGKGTVKMEYPADFFGGRNGL